MRFVFPKANFTFEWLVSSPHLPGRNTGSHLKLDSLAGVIYPCLQYFKAFPNESALRFPNESALRFPKESALRFHKFEVTSYVSVVSCYFIVNEFFLHVP